MKILTNTQNYMLGGIPRVIKNMLLDHNSIFNDIKFTTINLGEEKLKNRGLKTKSTESHRSITGYYNKSRFLESVHTYKDLNDIKTSFSDLIALFDSIITDENPDMIMLNGTGIVSRALLQASYKKNIPIVLYYHGSISIEESARIDKGATIIKDFEKSFISDKFGFIFPSLLLKHRLSDNLGISRKGMQTAVIPNSIPRYLFNFSHKNIKKHKMTNIGFVMRRCNIKNKHFVSNFSKFIKDNEIDYTINLITNDESLVWGELETHDRFIIHKQGTHKELSTFLRNMDIIICPSKFETYGNVPQECIAIGTPALIGINMGVKETFEDIELERLIIDFDKIDFNELLDIIDDRIEKGVSKKEREKLFLKYQTKEVNRKRCSFLNCFYNMFVRNFGITVSIVWILDLMQIESIGF